MAKIGRKRGHHNVFVDTTPATGGGGGGGPTIQTNRIAEWLFMEGSGQRAFNAAGANTSNPNIIGFGEGINWGTVTNYFNFTTYFNKNGGSNPDTLTPDFANNENGKPQAARLQTGAGSTVNGDTGAFSGLRIQGRSFAAGTYTMSLSVKSNTGSSQSMRMACSTSPISSDLPITTSWSRVSWTFSHPGGSVLLYFLINGSGGAALDVLFDKLQLEPGSSASAYVSPNFDLHFGFDTTSESVDPTWVSGKGVALANQYAFGYNTENPVTTTNFSIHFLAKLTPGNSAQGHLLSTVFGDSVFEFRMGKGGTADHTIQPQLQFGGGVAKAKILNIADGFVHHIAGTYDGTTLKLYVDKILFAQSTASLGPVTIKRIQLGYNDLVGGLYFNGEIYYGSMYNAAHSQTDVNTMFSALSSIAATRGITLASNNRFLIAEGDSITASQFTYTRKAVLNSTQYLLAENMAVVGDQVFNLVARASTIDSYYDAGRSKNILTVLIGANDMSGATSAATFVANLKSYCQARQATGWKVIVCTVLPNTNSGFNAKRNTANSLIVADPTFYDALCRFDLNANMGNDADASDTSKYSDGVHPTDAGHAFLAPDYQAAYESLL